MNYDNVDNLLKALKNVFPNGNTIIRLASHYIIGTRERTEIFNFLKDEALIEEHKTGFRLTRKGRTVIDDYGGIVAYFNALGLRVKKEKEIERIQEQKLRNEAKLSGLQAKTFWYFFSISIIGGLFAIYTTIERIFGEPIEEKIDRLIEERKSTQNRINEFSIDQTKNKSENEEQNGDTLIVN